MATPTQFMYVSVRLPTTLDCRAPPMTRQLASIDTGQLLGSLTSRLARTNNELVFALEHCESATRVQTVNLHHVYLARNDVDFCKALSDADVITADGWPVVVGLRHLVGDRSIERVTGVDYLADLVGGKQRAPGPVALLGASHGSGAMLHRLFHDVGIELAFQLHTKIDDWDASWLANRLNSEGIKLTMVAVTPPKGEIFASRLRDAGLQGAIISIGGAVDMVTGVRPRAPELLRAAKLEWAFRLCLEPRRLARRYMLECIPTFASAFVALLHADGKRGRGR